MERSCAVADVVPEYVFVVDARDPSYKVIRDFGENNDRQVHIVNIIEDLEPRREHSWKDESLQHMVVLRNALLRRVRTIHPDLFLSLDSDILASDNLVKNLSQTLATDKRGFSAVGGKCYLSPGTGCPSWVVTYPGGAFYRKEAEGIFRVDVIMAIKMMSPSAYSIDYDYHRYGEDFGWSFKCRDAGLKLGWDGRETSKHVMRQFDGQGRPMIDKVDKRCGF